jgi:ASC-1-like (ASCH) protein
MSVFNVPLRCSAFTNLNKGKIIEVRLYRGIFTKINKDDIIIFYSKGGSCEKTVKDVKYYNSLIDVFNNENINNILPDTKNIKDALKHYNDIYNNVNINEFKIVCFFI